MGVLIFPTEKHVHIALATWGMIVVMNDDNDERLMHCALQGRGGLGLLMSSRRIEFLSGVQLRRRGSVWSLKDVSMSLLAQARAAPAGVPSHGWQVPQGAPAASKVRAFAIDAGMY